MFYKVFCSTVRIGSPVITLGSNAKVGSYKIELIPKKYRSADFQFFFHSPQCKGEKKTYGKSRDWTQVFLFHKQPL